MVQWLHEASPEEVAARAVFHRESCESCDNVTERLLQNMRRGGVLELREFGSIYYVFFIGPGVADLKTVLFHEGSGVSFL